MDFPV